MAGRKSLDANVVILNTDLVEKFLSNSIFRSDFFIKELSEYLLNPLT